MNSSQPSTGGGGDKMTIIIVIVLLIAIGVGGYFGYTKWWVPKQCVGQAATSNVSTFMWDSDSSKCVANVCMSGYGSGSTAKTVGTPPCVTYKPRTYSAVPNLTKTGGPCTSDGSSTADGTKILTADTSSAPTASDILCGVACDNLTGCSGYDWDSTLISGLGTCNLYTTAPVGALATPTTTACHNSPVAGT